ncbi:hypothetical protein FHS18_000193 [Paenibacillus phyllosphaerae]|uniref:Uncharacterized protein n=1 Tax=Paenibacillus phyllosphaerae TaxID=274593 RepID=A0A7W5ASW3_9BACL|nr:hypothetical protein [Paenibacillus phyllosphaerae]MBB3108165.1 hypothetical protein [Paenibacillus phyllosphaerae]
MDELINEVDHNIEVLELTIERNKKAPEIPHIPEETRFMNLAKLCIALEKWKAVRGLLEKYRDTRCRPIEKKSSLFENMISVELKGVPGFVTPRTRSSMIEYMRHLEWQIDQLSGIWRTQEMETMYESVDKSN